MDVTGAMLQLNTPDGKMEAYEARPKDSGSYPGIVVLMEAFGLNDHIKSDGTYCTGRLRWDRAGSLSS